ncbi:hypothetical protein LOK49_LG09G00586 [Camellia lanceoleosa]|uniref:Uncharacterized protein n=1 Tax=Camellia lanceoleosa TaxID=1840588 RepID=A0ACC0GIL4_9ERIC|nr:hypothetical protein LOK49_LG09G00586 [Camellia lanceoleosa]
MAKLNWRSSSEGNSLWARTLKSKYGTTMRTCTKASSVWCSLGKGTTILNKGSKLLLKNSRITRFWLDDWAKCGPLRDCIKGPLNSEDAFLCVSDC